MALKKSSAYHGPGWKPRIDSQEQEAQDRLFWSECGYRSEFSKLKEVMLCEWRSPPVYRSSPDKIQHLHPVNWPQLNKELKNLKSVFKKNGVTVHALRLQDFDHPLPNLMFVRDHFFMTPWGAILGRMASVIRAGEEKWAQLAIARAGMPLLLTIHGTGTFEGADAIWLHTDCLMIGTGNRTNKIAFRQIQKLMNEYQVRCIEVPLPKNVQHLLGLVQIVAFRRALLRTSIAPRKLKRVLKMLRYSIIDIPEDEEVISKQALNVVILKSNTVIMPSDCPAMKARLKAENITIAAEVPVHQLLRAAGGIACATGILSRKRL